MLQSEHTITCSCPANEIMRRVVFVGVSPDSQGGIAAVLKSYKQNIEPFQMVESSRDGSKFTKLLVLFTAFFKLLFFRIKGCKIAHIHSASYNSFKRKKLLISYASLLGYRVVFHLHGGEFHKFTAGYGVERIRKVFNKCSAIAVLSAHWQKFIADTWQIPDAAVINNMISKPAVKTSPQTSQVLNLTFLGIIDERKGIFDLLTVLNANKDFYQDKICLTVCGNGEASKLQKFIAEHKLQNMVKYSGWISGKAKEQLLQSTDIYLLVSYNEGMPISILEAMSYHIPVIATPVGGINDLIKHERNGLLVPPGDHNELDKALKRLIADANLRKQISENNAVDIQEFFPEKVVMQLQKIYTDLLHNKKSLTCGDQ